MPDREYQGANKFIDGVVAVSLTEPVNPEDGRLWLDLGATDMAQNVNITGPVSAFGEVSVANQTPIVQVQYPYGINTQIVETRLNGGTATIDTNRLKLSTGASANRLAMAVSRKAIQYHPGQGALVRFTSLFTAGAANSTQLSGIGDSNDGFFFGYNGTAFGLLHRVGGASEMRTLTVSTGSSHAENITITLDSDAVATVAVTNTADTTLTANEIAAHDFSTLGDGWRVHAMGSKVRFISYTSGSKSGTYSLSSATSAVGTFGQDIVGASPTDTWTAQASWSEDVMDGTGTSGMTIDPAKGNVYQIQYEWLGFGGIEFFLESQTTKELVLVHVIHYTNQNTTPSINNPSLPLCALVSNAANTSDIIVHVGSQAGFIQGQELAPSLHFGKSAAKAAVSTTEVPILSIHNKLLYQGKENRTRIRFQIVIASTTGNTKPTNIIFYRGATLTGASFTDIDASDSVVSFDVSATATAGGKNLLTSNLAKDDRETLVLTKGNFELAPGEFFTATAVQTLAGGNSDVDVSLNWAELF